jgi:hypothetical protein
VTEPVRGESGTTLVEMVTVLALLSVVLVATFAAIGIMQSTSMGVDERIENLTESRLAMGTLSQDVRAATRPPSDPDSGSAFVTAGAMDLRFYANLRTTDGKPRLISVAVGDDGILRETVVEPQGALPYTYDGPPAERMVGGYVSNTPYDPLFIFYDAAGDPIVAANRAALTEAERLRIASVEIVLKVRRDPNPKAKPTTVQTHVRLPNVSVTRP